VATGSSVSRPNKCVDNPRLGLLIHTSENPPTAKPDVLEFSGVTRHSAIPLHKEGAALPVVAIPCHDRDDYARTGLDSDSVREISIISDIEQVCVRRVNRDRQPWPVVPDADSLSPRCHLHRSDTPDLGEEEGDREKKILHRLHKNSWFVRELTTLYLSILYHSTYHFVKYIEPSLFYLPQSLL